MQALKLLKDFKDGRCWSEISDESFDQFLQKNPSYFGKLIGVALKNYTDYSWRAAWLVARTLKTNDDRVKPYRLKMIRALRGKSSGHQRELMKILIDSKLTRYQEGCLFDVCVSIWENHSLQSGTRYLAFQFISKIMKHYPAMFAEVSVLFSHESILKLSPGIQALVKRQLNDVIERHTINP